METLFSCHGYQKPSASLVFLHVYSWTLWLFVQAYLVFSKLLYSANGNIHFLIIATQIFSELNKSVNLTWHRHQCREGPYTHWLCRLLKQNNYSFQNGCINWSSNKTIPTSGDVTWRITHYLHIPFSDLSSFAFEYNLDQPAKATHKVGLAISFQLLPLWPSVPEIPIFAVPGKVVLKHRPGRLFRPFM